MLRFSCARAASAVAFAILAIAGCGASSGDGATSDDDLAAARCESKYAAPLRAKVDAAKQKLDDSRSSYGAELRATLAKPGAVKVLPFCAMERGDFEHFADDVDLSAGGATRPEQWRKLRDGDEAIMRSVHAQLYGYEWGNRVYIASNMRAERTLETLAHEVKHVLRQAHLRNFHDQRVTCVEELEAARAEQLVHVDALGADEDRALMDRVHDLYELDKLAPGTCGYRGQ